jgi:hypothetical protein
MPSFSQISPFRMISGLHDIRRIRGVHRTLTVGALIACLAVAGCSGGGPSPAPVITSANNSGFAFLVGVAGSFTVTVSGTPLPTLTESGALPNGISFNATTGVLSGTAAAGTVGSYTITFTAHNGAGPDAVQNFTLTVNQPAAITSANNMTFTVGTAGTFTFTATGFPAPTFTETGALPGGVTLVSATGVLSGTPTAGSGGSYVITVTAHNGAGADSTQSFTLTVNQAAAITSANSTAFVVGTAGTFTVKATGFPAATLSEAGALPTGVSFNAATGVLSGTPAAGTAGSYAITFTAHNGIGADAVQNFTLSVNLAPAITSANSTTFTVGTAGAFAVTATGFPAPTFSETGALPAGVTLNGTTGALSGTPAAGTGGTYPIAITATNGVSPNATQNFTLTVNQAPAVTSTNSATFVVGTAGGFTVTGTGFPRPALSETGALPGGVTFVDNGNGTAALSGTPTAGTAGAYPITITASNGIGSNAVQNFTLTVNQAPAITSANNATFTVGTAGAFTVTATGAPIPTLSESGTLPSGVTFNTATGVLGGTPAAGTGGVYAITFTASNGVGANAVQNFTLTVNQAPTITSAAATTFTVGAAGNFTVTAVGPPIPTTITETGVLPTGVTLTNNGNGTATLSGTPGAGTAGAYPISITASNGISPSAVQNFTLTVDQSPAITSANNATFTAGTAGAFTVTATGVPTPTLSETGALPSGVTFVAATGVLSGTPAPGTGGVYAITFTASNGVGANAVQNFTLTVNQAPTITSAGVTTFTVGAAGNFMVTAVGPPTPTTISETGALPTGVTFTNNGNGTATLSGTPAAGTQGTYNLTFTASNGITPNAVQNFTLTVDQAPVVTTAAATTFTVGTAGNFTVTATGVPTPTITENGALPSGVTFSATPGTGTLSGTPAAGTGGAYPITFTASNGIGSNAVQNFTLTVNQAPAITSANSTTFTVGAAGAFTVTTTGNPKPAVTETGALPTGVTFVDNGNGTAALAGTPAAGTGGAYPISITAANGIGTNAVQSFTLTVNTAPVITSANNTTFTVGTAGNFTVTATGTPTPTLSETGSLPSGVTFNAATGVLGGTPAAGTGKAYAITFTASNAVGTNAVQSFTLTVNQAPAITSANNATFTVGAAGAFTVTATGFPAPTFSETGALPTGVTLNATTGALSGTPGAGTGGSYPIVITAANGVTPNATQNFTLTVNTAAVITSANNATFTVGAPGNFTVTATGTPTPILSATGSLPSGVTFVAATGVLSGTPAAGTGGAYALTFTASNGVGTNAVQNFTLTVNQAPAITSAVGVAFIQSVQSTFTVTASGVPAPAISEGGGLPTGVTFNAATNVLSGTPTVAGVFPITFTASNGVLPNAVQNFTLTVTTGPTVVGTAVPFPIFAGDATTAIPITVTNDAAGDVVTVVMTVDANTNLACTVATCGTLGAVTGTSGSGTYSLAYNPPAAASGFTQTVPTIVVSSSLPGSFADTDYIEVDPAGARLLLLTGIGGYRQAGSAIRTATVTIYNDVNPPNGITTPLLTASGFACSNLTTNGCGVLSAPTATVLSGTTSTTTFTYTPPAAVAAPATSPAPPYDRPRVQVASLGDNTQIGIAPFLINNNPAPVGTGLAIPRGSKFNSALAAAGAAPITVFANIGNDTGNSMTVTWTLTAGGVNCSPACGTLGAQIETWNGGSVSSQINYTPPATVPTLAANLTPTITATSVDAPAMTDNFTFKIADGSCGTGNNAVLNGSYAFLLRGGGMVAGYTVILGSFTANGTGGVTGGLLDANVSWGPTLGLTIQSTGSSYTVGADHSACVVLADSQGGVSNFRVSLGTLVSGVATQGRMIRFDDNNGRRARQSGMLMKQTTSSFANSQFNGNYAFGEEGVDGTGGRLAGAGVVTSNGTGTLTNIIADFDGAGVVSGPVTGGTGTYAIASNGRGTATTTLTVLGKTSTGHLIFQMVSSTEVLFMSSDSAVTGTSIFSGEMRKQTGPFTGTTFDNSGFVLHVAGLAQSGGNDTSIGQLTFTTNGNATLTIDENLDGTMQTENIVAITLNITPSGRATVTGAGAGNHPPIGYLIDSSSAFLVGTDPAASLGFVEKQTGGPFTNASLSGPFYFVGDAPNTGSPFDVGTATFNGAGSVTGTDNESSASGLNVSSILPTNGGTYSFSNTSVPQGKGTVGQNLAYIISSSKLIFMNTNSGSSPEIYIIQK